MNKSVGVQLKKTLTHDLHGWRVLHGQQRARVDGLALAEQERVLAALRLAYTADISVCVIADDKDSEPYSLSSHCRAVHSSVVLYLMVALGVAPTLSGDARWMCSAEPMTGCFGPMSNYGRSIEISGI